MPQAMRAGWVAVIPAGLLSGVFMGMVSGAIAEVAAILARTGRRLGISRWLPAALAGGSAVEATLWWAAPSPRAG